jgi:hypothetical protein
MQQWQCGRPGQLQLCELLQKPNVNGGFCPENSWRMAFNRRKSVGISEPCDWSADQKQTGKRLQTRAARVQRTETSF